MCLASKGMLLGQENNVMLSSLADAEWEVSYRMFIRDCSWVEYLWSQGRNEDWAGREAEMQCLRKAPVSVAQSSGARKDLLHSGVKRQGHQSQGQAALARKHALARWFSSSGATSKQGCLQRTKPNHLPGAAQ